MQTIKTKTQNFERKQHLVGGYKLMLIFAICNTNENNMSSKSKIDYSFSNKSTIDNCKSKS